MKQQYDLTPAALYARVSSERQDVDLSVAAQLRALRDYAEKNGYHVAREYVDEAESGRIADRPQFQKMLDEAAKPEAPFKEILVWKFSRFTRKREHAVAFKSMLRRRGIRVVSITEHADDSPTGKLMEAIIESVDEFYSENLAQEVVRGMRESASRGFWVASRVPYGYRKLMVQDGAKKRPTLEPDPTTAAVVERIFGMAEAGRGILDITRTLNDEGIANPTGRLWSKNGVHIILRNEVYTGTLVWGIDAKDKADPVRVEKAFPAIISKARFRRVNRKLRSRAPRRSHPRRVGSTYLLSGLVRCKACNRALSGQDAKSGKFAYYVCQSVMKRGSGACNAPRLNARRFEEQVVGKIRENVLTESNIRTLVKLVDEEMDGVAKEQRQKLETIEAELVDVKRRLGRLYDLAETTDLDIDDFKPRIREHRERQEKLEATAEEARAMLSQRREVLGDVETITAYALDMNMFLNESELTERRAFIESFVKEIVVMPDSAVIRYTIPMPDDSPIPGRDVEEMALNGSVLSTVKFGGARPDPVGRSADARCGAHPRRGCGPYGWVADVRGCADRHDQAGRLPRRQRGRPRPPVRVRAAAQLRGVFDGIAYLGAQQESLGLRSRLRAFGAPPPLGDGSGLSEEELLERGFARPAATPALRGPEVDCASCTADLQVLPQRFGCRGESAPDRLGRLALSGLQLPRLSGAYVLDVLDVLLKQRRALARHGIRACFAYRNSVKRGHPAYLLEPAAASGSHPLSGQDSTVAGSSGLPRLPTQPPRSVASRELLGHELGPKERPNWRQLVLPVGVNQFCRFSSSC